MRERAQREAHRLKAGGSWSDVDWNRTLQEAYDAIYEKLSVLDEGFNLSWRCYTVGADTPAGPTLTLPDSYLDLRNLARSRASGPGWSARPRRTSYKAISEVSATGLVLTSAAPGYYLIEGPGREFDADLQVEVDFSQRLRFWPDLVDGEQVAIAYTTQPLSWGDPKNLDDDITSRDVVSEAIERAICTMARVVASEQSSPKEYQRAVAERDQALRDFEASKQRRDSSEPIDLDAIEPGGQGWVGYGGSW